MQLPEPSSVSRPGAGGLPGSSVNPAPSAPRRRGRGLRSLAAVIAAGGPETGGQASRAERLIRDKHARVSSIDRSEDLEFFAFKGRSGEDRPIAAAHGDIRLWPQAVRESHTDGPRRVRGTPRRQNPDAPEDDVAVDADTQHTWQPAFIGRVRGDGQFEIVWTSRTSVWSVPFPNTRSRSSWETLVEDLHPVRGVRWSPTTDRRRPERPSGDHVSRAGEPSS